MANSVEDFHETECKCIIDEKGKRMMSENSGMNNSVADNFIYF